MTPRTFLRLCFCCSFLFLFQQADGFQKPKHEELANFDRRKPQAQDALQRKHVEAKALLQKQLPKAQVDFDEVTGTVKSVSASDGFLSGNKASGRGVSSQIAPAFPANEPHRATKAFLQEHRGLFGHGPEVLTNAKIKREFVTSHNGMRSVVWQQHFNDIPIFEGLLISHTTQNEELVKISSHFVSNPAEAARAPANGNRQISQKNISAATAVVLAAEDIGDNVNASNVASLGVAEGAHERQKFNAHPLKGETEAQLVWLPMNDQEMRLCWQIVFTSAARGEMFKTLVDAQTGEILLRHGLTEYISDASYRVFTSDSPSPFSPGHPTPLSTQPAVVSRVLIVTNAFNTNASPNGWINDGVNQTMGNNVDAHADANADNIPDLPRPQGAPYRVFDFPIDFAQAPSTYRKASVVQLFFLCNWYHDKLYELGFTEAAGNFQVDNFGRGGLGNDPVLADAQDGGDFDNANFSTPTDGSSGRMQMFLWNTPHPDRDGSFDAEIVFHEYTHGLSNRRVGGGIGLSALQSRGMGEGWSDFYALCLLAEPEDDVNGNYATGGYATYQLDGITENYYFGIRRYPYSTDMTKNPLTFKDIDPGQASAHMGIPTAFSAAADKVHSQGEVWCSALWEVRANLINKYGFATGNQLILQLVTDGMNLSPANPNFLQARDAIIQADQINNGGANHDELWAGFAKRGMGAFATSPSSSTTVGVVESFSVPDDLRVNPEGGFTSIGPVGGPFSPAIRKFDLINDGFNIINWSAGLSADWLTISQADGMLSPGDPATTVSASINSAANSLAIGAYTNVLHITNLTSGLVHSRAIILKVGLPDFLTEFFENSGCDLDNQMFTFTPDGSPGFYSICRGTASELPTNPVGGNSLTMQDDSFATVTLPAGTRVKIFGSSNNVFYIGSNGYITLGGGDNVYTISLDSHFNRPRISGLFTDLVPGPGQISWKQMSNRVAVTYSSVPQYKITNSNTFQIEMFFDGVIRLTFLQIDAGNALTGLSKGTGVPGDFANSDFSSYGTCANPFALHAFLSEGTLAIQFNTMLGSTYEIQYSDDLIDWTPVAPTILGTGSIEQWLDDTSDSPVSESARFFRIVTQ